jgi:putative oxidoreductase
MAVRAMSTQAPATPSGYSRPRGEVAYALLRSVSGLMFAFHGAQKLFGLLGGAQPRVGTQLWFGGLIELFAGLAIAVGAFTVWAAFLASGTMAVAYVQYHWRFRVGAGLLPGLNGGELAVLYAFSFLFIVFRGGGAFSLDRVRARRRQSLKGEMV